MTYTKPVVTVLGSAKVLIQAIKPRRVEPSGAVPGNLS